MSNGLFYWSTGGLAALYTVYAGLRLYSLGGEYLVSAADAKRMITSGEIKTVIDVRTEFEYRMGHYPRARSLPVGNITAERVKSLNKETGVLVYCNTGQRARRASEMLRDLGFKRVYYIDGTYKSLM